MLLLSIRDTPLEPAAGVCRRSANIRDLQGRAAWSLLDTTVRGMFFPFYKFLTTPQMHLVNSQCDNVPERALHFTGEEEGYEKVGLRRMGLGLYHHLLGFF